MTIRIELLSQHPDWLPVVAEWIYNEWWTHVADASPANVAELLQDSLTSDLIPVTLVATIDERPVGTVSLLEHDVETEHWPEYTPWLAALFVVPEYRGVGVGTMLVSGVCEIASSLGFRVLYLLTGEEAYYSRRGWESIDRSGRSVIMRLRV